MPIGVYPHKSPSKGTREKISQALTGRKREAFSEETRVKMSLAKLGNQLRKGSHFTKEQKKRLSEAHMGQSQPTPMPEEVRAKIRATLLGHPVSKETKDKIRLKRLLQVFPQKDTKPEVAFQDLLTELGIPFKKHIPVLGICQTDVFIEPNICVFIDGDYWHNLPSAIIRDIRNNYILSTNGYEVLRFWEHELVKRPRWVRNRVIKTYTTAKALQATRDIFG